MARATRAHRQGRFESASLLYASALATSQAFPPGDPRTLQTLSQRAELRLSQGQYDAAERDYRAIIAAERSNSPGNAEQLANALNNLAVFYLDLNRIDEAETLLVEAIEIRTAALRWRSSLRCRLVAESRRRGTTRCKLSRLGAAPGTGAFDLRALGSRFLARGIHRPRTI